jgi:hypothetical protein
MFGGHMLARRALLSSLLLLTFTAFAAADIDTNSARMGRSVLLKPIQVMEANGAFTSTANDFRATGIDNALTRVSDTHGVASEVLESLNSWARTNRGDDFNTWNTIREDRSPVEIAAVAAVPEPATMTLLASGLVGLVLRRRTR